MKKSLLLTAALALVVLPMPLVVAHAQTEAGGIPEKSANTRAAKRAAAAKKGGVVAAPLFPKATRVEPKQAGTPALAKQLNALFELQEKPDSEDALIEKADAILADSRANAFDKSSAGYLAGYAWLGKDSATYTNASKYIKGAIDDNGLANNTHYQMMLQLAQMLESEDKHAEALAYVDRYLTETKSDDTKAYNLKAAILVGMDKPAEAAKVLEEVLRAKPDDKVVMRNLASLYQQSGDDAKAGQIFDRMRSAGMLTESKDYDMAWRLLANIEGRSNDAVALIEEGLKKGILQPSYDVYAYLGQTYYADEKNDKAIEAWAKGAPLSKNGEMYLNLAKLQVDGEKWADAKASAQGALGKGVKKTGDAWQVIARAEAGAGNKPAAVAAYKEAAKYPETRKWAESALRQASGK